MRAHARAYDRLMTGDDWRVDVELDDEEHGYMLGERLRALDLDDEARKRLGQRVIVSRTGSTLFLYTTSRTQADEAARVVRELVSADRLTAEVRILRWHPDAREWEDADVPLPRTEAERAEEHERLEERHRADVEAGGAYDWVVDAIASDHPSAVTLERQLRQRQLPVRRVWRYLIIGALGEEQANEIGSLILELAPGTEVGVEPVVDEPSFVLARALL
jgi:hypothetical protein